MSNWVLSKFRPVLVEDATKDPSSCRYRAYSLRWPASANLLEKKKAFTLEKSSTPTGFSWYTNVAATTSCEYALYDKTSPVPKWPGFVMNPEKLLYCKPKHRTKSLVL